MKIEAHGLVVIYENKLLVSKDKKDGFYKIPGGRIENAETGKETAIRELEEETGLIGIVENELSTQILDKNTKTGEPQEIELHHYIGKLENLPENFNTYEYDGHEIRWIDLDEIGEYDVAPNIKFLLERGELK